MNTHPRSPWDLWSWEKGWQGNLWRGSIMLHHMAHSKQWAGASQRRNSQAAKQPIPLWKSQNPLTLPCEPPETLEKHPGGCLSSLPPVLWMNPLSLSPSWHICPPNSIPGDPTLPLLPTINPSPPLSHSSKSPLLVFKLLIPCPIHRETCPSSSCSSLLHNCWLLSHLPSFSGINNLLFFPVIPHRMDLIHRDATFGFFSPQLKDLVPSALCGTQIRK